MITGEKDKETEDEYEKKSSFAYFIIQYGIGIDTGIICGVCRR